MTLEEFNKKYPLSEQAKELANEMIITVKGNDGISTVSNPNKGQIIIMCSYKGKSKKLSIGAVQLYSHFFEEHIPFNELQG